MHNPASPIFHQTSVFKGDDAANCPLKKRGKKENSDADLIPANAPPTQQQPRGLMGSAAVRGLCAANPPVCAAGSFDRWSCQALRHALLQLQKKKKKKRESLPSMSPTCLLSPDERICTPCFVTRAGSFYATQRGQLCR